MKNVIKYLYALCLFACVIAHGSQAAENFAAVAPLTPYTDANVKLGSEATALKPLDLSTLCEAERSQEDVVSPYVEEAIFSGLNDEIAMQQRIDSARLKMEEAASSVILEHAQRCAKLAGAPKATANISVVVDEASLLKKSGLLKQSLKVIVDKHWPKDLQLRDQGIESQVEFYLSLGKGATHTTYNVELAMRKYRSTLTDYLAAMHK